MPPERHPARGGAAIEAGYRHIDTAAAYNNEAGVGAAIKACGLPREELFVTTKLRNGEQGYDSALAAYDESCSGWDWIRSTCIWCTGPFPSADRYVDSWRALERIYTERRVRAIGVSNFLPEHLERLFAETELVPAVNQIELHPTSSSAKSPTSAPNAPSRSRRTRRSVRVPISSTRRSSPSRTSYGK